MNSKEEKSLPQIDRWALLRLPLLERRRIMEQQAKAALPYYEQDSEWVEWVNCDLTGIDGIVTIIEHQADGEP